MTVGITRFGQDSANSAPDALETAARLLALLLRARWTGEDGIAAAAVGVAPKALETQLRLHGVAGVLSLRHVEQIQQLPAPLAVAIASTQRRSIPASLKLAGACLTACRALEKAGIPVLPLKGQALSWQIYGAIGVRHSGDIDLLVDPADVPAAIEVMQDTGYQSTLPLPSSPLHWRERMRTVHHLNFRDRDNGGLELHWRTDPLRRTSLPALSRLLPELTLMADGPLRGLRQLPMPRLLHSLASHACRSRCARWKWGYDLMELIGSDGTPPWQPQRLAEQDPYTRAVLRSMAVQLGVPGWRRWPADVVALRAATVERRELLRGGPGVGRTLIDGAVLHSAAWAALRDAPARIEYLAWMSTRVSPEIGDAAYSRVARHPWLAPALKLLGAVRRPRRD